jgi:hypothetical protein
VTHPEERFWQALRKWSGYAFIMANDVDGDDTIISHDTFYIQGRRHDENEN